MSGDIYGYTMAQLTGIVVRTAVQRAKSAPNLNPLDITPEDALILVRCFPSPVTEIWLRHAKPNHYEAFARVFRSYQWFKSWYARNH